VLEVDAVPGPDLNHAPTGAGEKLTTQFPLALPAITPAKSVKEAREQWVFELSPHRLKGYRAALVSGQAVTDVVACRHRAGAREADLIDARPDAPAAQAAIQCQIELQARAGGDALIGRQVYPLMVKASFEAVRVSPRMV
jgi:hypothetical protein